MSQGRRWLSREEVRLVAKQHCASKGWPWVEPVHVRCFLRTARVMTNASHRGGNVNVEVDRLTGEVKRSGFAPL